MTLALLLVVSGARALAACKLCSARHIRQQRFYIRLMQSNRRYFPANLEISAGMLFSPVSSAFFDPWRNSLSDETTTGIITANLPDTNWEGREFRVLGYVDDTYPQFSNFEIYSDGETGEVVNNEYIAATEL